MVAVTVNTNSKSFFKLCQLAVRQKSISHEPKNKKTLEIIVST
ncbi:uncharacterized protein METZ01_LOCUS288460 [marine metagenome]|uniref:Uncharacterized protein n=1 Tax=marine metagenome TaxID=408172 RepID=A0A382LG74_9ZZZZ